MSHANAVLTPKGRLRLAQCFVDDRWPLHRSPKRFQVSVSTAVRWAARYRGEGKAGMQDRPSRPGRSPRRTPKRRERRIIALRTEANRRPGYMFLHNAVDDHSRLAYTEILADEKKETAAGFRERANAYFESCGITVTRVLTDTGSCYRSHAFKDALGEKTKHKAPAHTGHRPTARSSATTAPGSRNGPTPQR